MRAQYHDLVRRDIFDMLPNNVGRVLDFGGGVGATSLALKQERSASEAILFDQVAEERLDGIDAAIGLDLNDKARIRSALEENGPFDTILALDILEHLQDPWEIVNVLDKALNPGGSLIVSVPNICHLSVIASLILGKFSYVDAGIMDRTHIRWFTPKSTVELATISGLVHKQTSHNFSGRKFQILNRITFGSLPHLFASQTKVRVQKVA